MPIVEFISQKELEELKSDSLPFYTILLPLFQEKNTVALLINAIKRLDYPSDKLQVLLILEEEDRETLQAVLNTHVPVNWQKINLKNSMHTKPFACQEGLKLAVGEFLVVYDAEDLPENDQLKKAVLAHKKIGASCFSVQAALNFYNYNENFITAFSSIEYCSWIDYLLPMQAELNLPILLGVASNHFNTGNLKEIGGWDSKIMSLNADVGVRAYEENLLVGVFNSTTFEEANSNYTNWIRQHSRRYKGLFQTFVKQFKKENKSFKKWIAAQAVLTAPLILHLVNPFIWLMLIIWLVGFAIFHITVFSTPFIYFNLMAFWIINFGGIYLNMLGVYQRKLFHLIPLTLLTPFYWLFFHSVATYKGLWQWFFKPYYWEKTVHGISKYSTKP